MNNMSRQIKLFSLLRYYGSGDYSTFKNIIVKSGYDIKDSPFFIRNQLLALNIIGAIEIIHTASVFKWCTSFDADQRFLKVGKSPSKVIDIDRNGIGQEMVTSIITDYDDICLINGWLNHHDNTGCVVYNPQLIEKIQPKSLIEINICIEEKVKRYFNDEVEVYNPIYNRWNICNISDLKAPSLIKIDKDFTGKCLYLAFPETNLYFRIINPSWAFLIAASHLGWDINNFVKFESSNVSIDMTFKLPTLLHRLLFTTCKGLKIGRTLDYYGLEKDYINCFINYINNYSIGKTQ